MERLRRPFLTRWHLRLDMSISAQTFPDPNPMPPPQPDVSPIIEPPDEPHLPRSPAIDPDDPAEPNQI
jgi:hypothetical protein